MVLAGGLCLSQPLALAAEGPDDNHGGSSGSTQSGSDSHDDGGDDHGSDDHGDGQDGGGGQDGGDGQDGGSEGSSGHSGNSGEDDSEIAREAVRTDRAVSLKDILGIVQKRHDGEVVNVSLERQGSTLTYMIKLLDTANRIVEFQINAASGQITLIKGL